VCAFGRKWDEYGDAMPFFRVPFSGSLLIEADAAAWANIVSAGWTVSMKQATHGVAIQAIPPPGVAAVELKIDENGIGEVTQQFHASMAQDQDAAGKNPGPELIARKFCAHNYHVGLQIAWESFEFQRTREQGS
jgi:hypothetical protein